MPLALRFVYLKRPTEDIPPQDMLTDGLKDLWPLRSPYGQFEDPVLRNNRYISRCHQRRR